VVSFDLGEIRKEWTMTASTELPEIGEPQETTRDASEVDDSINTAFEPIEKVASEGTFEDSEAIEAALVELIDSVQVVQPTVAPAAETSLPEGGHPTTPNPRPEASDLSQGEYMPSFLSHAETVLDNIEGQTETVNGAMDGLKMANEMVEELDELLNKLQAENPEGEDQEAASKKVTDDDSRKPLQDMEDPSIVAGVEAPVDVHAEIDKQDLLDTLRSEVAEANEDLGDGTGVEIGSGIKSNARDLPVGVSGPGGEPDPVMGDLSNLGRKGSDTEGPDPEIQVDETEREPTTVEPSGTQALDSDMVNWKESEPVAPVQIEGESDEEFDERLNRYRDMYIAWQAAKPTDEGTDGDNSADDAVSAGQLAAPFIPGSSVISSSIGDGDPSTG
jgi:hypothetical protein